MNNLDANVIRSDLGAAAAARLGRLEIFAEIESTNSYLMQQPAPAHGKMHVAATDNQTAGRGRHGRTWQSPPGSGLCLSMAHTFASPPPNLPVLTLAIGLGAIETLKELKATAVQLKWPNDLIAMDCKLGGILTESQAQPGGAMTVVTGIGLNIDLNERVDAILELVANDYRNMSSFETIAQIVYPIVVVLLIVALVWFLIRRRKASQISN